LERVREELKRESAVGDFGRGLLAAAHSATMGRRLVAIEELWDVMCRAGQSSHLVLSLVDVLTQDELEADVSRNFAGAVGSLDMEALKKAAIDTRPFNKHRPFVGDRIWSHVYVATHVPGRILALYSGLVGPMKGSWKDDRMIQELLSMVLDDAEKQAFIKVERSPLTWLNSVLQQRFLALASDLTSGKAIAAIGLAHARKLIEVEMADRVL
jgi:hypothetical protein